MGIFWSAKEQGFFDSRLPYVDFPDDAVEIDPEYRDKLIQAQCEGWQIVVGADGMPDLIRRE
jgi:hypothetical protein